MTTINFENKMNELKAVTSEMQWAACDIVNSIVACEPLDETNEYHKAAMAAYGAENVYWERWTDHGWEKLGTPSTVVEMYAELGAYIYASKKGIKWNARPRMAKKFAATRIRRIKEVIKFMRKGYEIHEDKRIVSRANEIWAAQNK